MPPWASHPCGINSPLRSHYPHLTDEAIKTKKLSPLIDKAIHSSCKPEHFLHGMKMIDSTSILQLSHSRGGGYRPL